MAVVHGIIRPGESMRWQVKGADASTGAERLINVEAPDEGQALALANGQGLVVAAVQRLTSEAIAAGPGSVGAREGPSGATGSAVTKHQQSPGAIRFSRRAIWVVGLVLAGGLGAWYWASRPDDVVVVGSSADPAAAAAPAAGAPAIIRIRVLDVLSGIPGASTPERSEWPVTWTSHFTLAGGEAGVLSMQIDPADLNFASITLPMPPSNDDASAERVGATAKRFLRNVAPDYDGAGWWLSRAIKTVAEHPEQTQSTKTERATFTVRAFQSGKTRKLQVQMRLNR